MIQAEFSRHQGSFTSVSVTGHAGFAPHGGDIVCASVTSALQLVCNGITEVLKAPAHVEVRENLVGIALPAGRSNTEAAAFLQALYLHLKLLREDYPQNLTITVSEV